MCSGHAQQGGDYHYHFPPSCLISQAETAESITSTEHSPQIGWAFDGFPVYGPRTTDGEDPDVDECGGVEESLPAVDDFAYRYYVRGDVSNLYALPTHPKPSSSLPFFTLRCYRGYTCANVE